MKARTWMFLVPMTMGMIGMIGMMGMTTYGCGVGRGGKPGVPDDPAGVGKGDASDAVADSAPLTIRLDPAAARGPFDGWGTSLAWWAQGAGGSAYQDLYADLFFTRNQVRVLDRELPGLGMNIVRYNVGGGGQKDLPATPEQVPVKVP